MSFNFSDDDDDFDLDAYDDTGLLALASRERAEGSAFAAATAATAATTTAWGGASPAAAAPVDRASEADANDVGNDEEESDGGDWDDVDWEDANPDDNDDEDEDDEDDRDALRQFPTQGVMINFGKAAGKSNDPDEGAKEETSEAKDEGGEPPTKRRRKNTRVLRKVSPETRRLVLDVRRSHMLCCVARCVRLSSFVSGGRDADESDGRRLLSHAAHSLIPLEFHRPDFERGRSGRDASTIRTRRQLHQFSQWFFQFVNHVEERRRVASRRNAARGAASARPRRSARRGRKPPGANEQTAKNVGRSPRKRSHEEGPLPTSSNRRSSADASPADLLRTLVRLSPRYDEDPQLLLEEEGADAIDAVERISPRRKVLLFLAMARSVGWRARYVTSLSPTPLQLTVDHPLLVALSSFKYRKPSESSDAEPAANIMRREQSDTLQRLLRFVHGGGMLSIAGIGGDRNKKESGGTNAAAAGNTIDLVSSGDEDETSKKEGNLDDRPAEDHKKEGNLDDCPAKDHEKEGNLDDCPAEDPNGGLLSWVEVLCRDDDGSGGGTTSSSKPAARWVPIHPEQESFDRPEEVESILAWIETNGSKSGGQPGASEKKRRGETSGWGMVPKRQDRRYANEYARKSPVSYVLAAEHPPYQAKGARVADVTPRYAGAWSRTLRLRGATGREITAEGGKCADEWWEASLGRINGHRKKTLSKPPVRSVTKKRTASGREVDVVELESSDDGDGSDSDEHETAEARELTGGTENEKIPTSKAAFKQSPFYVIPSVLNSRDVLRPDACKRVVGAFKGELVYRRRDASKALRADKWLYQGRRVKEGELERPAKRVKARKKPVVKGFQALTSYGVSEEAQEDMISSMDKRRDAGGEEMHDLYGIWQTEPWSPPYVGPADDIPTNDFRNVELALINPGLTHLDQRWLAPVAKKLGIPYAPCMLGFEGRGGARAPTVRGIVAHDHNVALLREAFVEWESHAAEKEREERRNGILKRWKRLVVGITTKERINREYGDA